ncbi:hypothetical protein F5Y18DRAFT_34802 [Xylariaceae sp. FL1019]|nr:hypothetical protein F5Y18DRAFT_34802 [Xylariaceae sp. FL1019]
MSVIPQIQILDKKNYFTQALVSLPDAVPLPPLQDSSLRIRTVVLTISLNTIANATKSEVLSSWTVYPQPPNTPAPYHDTSKYGCINIWGYGQVIESTFASVNKGSYVYGYLPIGTLPFDITVENTPEVQGHVVATNASRKHLLAVYNRYIVHPEEELAGEIDRKSPALAFDCAFRVMHESAFVLNRWVYAPIPEHSVPLSGLHKSFTPDSTDLSDATVIVLAPGSKIALAFAWMLRNDRSEAGAVQPRQVIGVASEHSIDFVRGTGFYDESVLTSEDPESLLRSWDVPEDKNVVLIDFGGRAGTGNRWATALNIVHPKFRFAMVGVEALEGLTGDAARTALGLGGVPFNLSHARDAAIKKCGEAAYFKSVARSLQSFRQVRIPGLEVQFEEGMEAVLEGYQAFCTSKTRPNVGFVYKI